MYGGFDPLFYMKGLLVLYDGFSQYPELIPGNIYCIDDYRDNELKLYGYDGWYDELLFSHYNRGDCFQHYDKSEANWTIPEVGEEYRIRLRRLNWMRNSDRLIDIPISDIQWYQEEKYGITADSLYCPCCGGSRVIEADITYPGILLDGTTTITGKRYRSMDGSHRIQKMLYYGYTTAPCYVFHIDEVLNYFEPY